MKKTLSMLLVLAMIFSLAVPAFAAHIDVSVSNEKINAGDNVVVTITLEEPIDVSEGATAMQGELHYDGDVLEFVNVEIGENYQSAYFSAGKHKTENKVLFSYLDTSFNYGPVEFQAGTLVTVTFKALEDIDEDHISTFLEFKEAYVQNAQGQNVGDLTYDTGVTVLVCKEHTWNEGEVTNAATCVDAGVMTYTCTFDGCGETKTEEIAATGHTYENGTCTVCGEADPDYVAPHEHSYEAVVTKPTCTEGGYTTYTCSCGDSYTANETAAKGHSYVAGICTGCGEADADYVAPTVDVYFSLSSDAEFLLGDATGEVMGLKQITVPYFDLALYGMESFYFSSESYGDDGDGQPGSDLDPGTPEFADGKITMLHLFIYATEVYYCGVDPSEAGQGYLYEEGLMPGDALDIGGSQGSSFINYIWGKDMNLNYYLNYEYPLASEGWGATSDQILLEDGDIVTLGHFTSWSFFNDSTSIFNYMIADTDTAEQGEEVNLTLMCAGPNMGNTDGTAQNLVTYMPDVYYIALDDMASGDVTTWNYLGTADENGEIVLDTTDLAPGQYMVAIAGQYGAEYPDEIVSTPGGVLLTVEEADHEHSYEAVVTEPTCTAGGYTTYTCSCGDTYTADETEALGHTEETVPGYAATCTETGLTDGVECSVCGETLVEQEEIPALGHNYEDGICTVCGAEDPDYVAPHEHSYEAVVTEPTCTEGGYTTYTCSCGDTYTADETEALGHTVETWTLKRPAAHQGKCTVCGTTVQEEHTFGEWVVTEEPTCTEKGWESRECAVCGMKATQAIEALGHTEETVPGYAATCTETGLTEGKHCSVCGETQVEQEEIPALGHNYEDGKCTECGAEDPDYVAPHEHSYEAVVTEPTCTEGGYTTYTCSCGDTYTADETEALGHNVVLMESEDATCELNGYEYYACERCGGEEYTIILEATGHNYEDGTCTECGAEDPDYEEAPKPSWSSWFEKWFGSWWGDDEEEECDHSYTSVVTDPTCTEKGYTTHTCDKCGDSYKDSYTDALGHSYVDGVCEHCGAAENKKPGWGGWFDWFWPFW